MQRIVLCLTIALVFGVTLCQNRCHNTIKDLNSYRNEFRYQNYDAKRAFIAHHNIPKLMIELREVCNATELCSYVRPEILKNRAVLETEGRVKVRNVAKINWHTAELKKFDEIALVNCTAELKCQYALKDVTASRANLARQRAEKIKDVPFLNKYTAEIRTHESHIAEFCPANQTCSLFRQYALVARSNLNAEFLDPKNFSAVTPAMITQGNDVMRYEAAMEKNCTREELCEFATQDLEMEREFFESQKESGTYLRIVKSQVPLAIKRYTNHVNKYCDASPMVRLFERVVKGGRFLSKIMRH